MMAMEYQTSLENFSQYDERLTDPTFRYELLGYAREHCPVARSEQHGGYWVVTSYPLVAQVLQDTRTFLSGMGVTVPHNPAQPLMPPIDSDGAAHRDWRRLLNPYVSPSALELRRPEMERIANELMDDFVDRGSCEIMDEFAEPFAARVLADVILGVDDAEQVRAVQRSNHAISKSMDSVSAENAFSSLRAHVTELVRERKSHPREDDVVTGVVNASIQGEPVTEELAINCVMILFLGGLDTVTDAIGNICYRIAGDPALTSRVRDRLWFREQVDEFLRLDSPVSALSRTAAVDTDLAGSRIQKGEQVLVSYQSANRDESVFSKSGELDFERPTNRHLSFGLGPHRCVGSHLARLELDVAFSQLLSRIDELRLSTERGVKWKAGISFGPSALWLEFTPARR
jgi:cytochrome P450